MESKNNFVVKKHITVVSTSKEDVQNRIKSLRDKLKVVMDELDSLERDVNNMEN